MSSSPRPRFGPFIAESGFAAPGTRFAAIFSRNARAAAFLFSSFFRAFRSETAAMSSASLSLGGNGGSLEHIPRRFRGTVLPPRIRLPSSVFWAMRLLFFFALLRALKSTVMAADLTQCAPRKSAAAKAAVDFATAPEGDKNAVPRRRTRECTYTKRVGQPPNRGVSLSCWSRARVAVPSGETGVGRGAISTAVGVMMANFDERRFRFY